MGEKKGERWNDEGRKREIGAWKWREGKTEKEKEGIERRKDGRREGGTGKEEGRRGTGRGGRSTKQEGLKREKRA